jgi:hypothetical protein
VVARELQRVARGSSKEFLDFLACIYGRDFADEAARKAVARAIADGDSIVRAFRIYDAAGIPKPDYVQEHERHFRLKGVEATSSGRRQLAGRLATWYERWATR